MQFSSTHSISVPHVLQNQGPLILLVHPFQKISQPPGQDLQNGNQIYCQLPPIKSYKSYGVQITGKLFAGLKN